MDSAGQPEIPYFASLVERIESRCSSDPDVKRWKSGPNAISDRGMIARDRKATSGA